MREYMRRLAVYINDESDDCLLCDCNLIPFCTFSDFRVGTDNWSRSGFDEIVRVDGQGWREVVQNTDFDQIRVSRTMPDQPVRLTRFEANVRCGAYSPAATVVVTVIHGGVSTEIYRQAGLANGEHHINTDTDLSNVTRIDVFIQSFGTPYIRDVRYEYESSAPVDTPC